MIKNTIKQQIFDVLEFDSESNLLNEIVNIFILTLIVLNLISFCLETVKSIWDKYQLFFEIFDYFSVLIFTVEYVLRVWSCTVDGRFSHAIWGRIRYIFTPLILIDLIAIIPYYLPLIFPNLIFVRVIRLLRFLRILKLSRYSDSLRTMLKVFVAKREELAITFFMVFILLFMASSLIYIAEHKVQPEVFASIPASMWWGVTTLTTVGYGDVYPVTPLGKLLGAMVAILGIGIFALPAGILASGFSEEMQSQRIRRRQKSQIICPHCGKAIHKAGTRIIDD